MAASGRSRVGGCDVTCIRSIAINNLINDNQQYVLLSDSLSVLTALQCSNIHCKSIIKFLGHEIYKIIGNIQSIEFVWTPGDADITENEYVDSLTRKASSSLISQWISHEDLLLFMKNFIQEEARNQWKNSIYYHEFYFLNGNRLQLRIFPSNRKNEGPYFSVPYKNARIRPVLNFSDSNSHLHHYVSSAYAKLKKHWSICFFNINVLNTKETFFMRRWAASPLFFSMDF
ncbi:hypothetical protein AVEN_226768-1 [Araneus ventricosus]|uniref:RNase H type-1 domain-containing protein n=1 Tax=Araneus ventricosus TaxID=182803 RepID=A0A4Y2JNG3_ARAVE|nr:hypothetical protein AVEN_226768-1 [Araneus ventricosus]